MDAEASSAGQTDGRVAALLHGFLSVQQRRAEAYSKLRRVFSECMINGGELALQQLCGNVTAEFNDCSKQPSSRGQNFVVVILPTYSRMCKHMREISAAGKLSFLRVSARVQVLKIAGRPSERLVNHENCRSHGTARHVCVHLNEITEAAGTEDAEAAAEYDGALKEAIQGIQDAVTSINEHMEDVLCEIDALEEWAGGKLTGIEEAFSDTMLIN